ncbi:MAG TPA: amidohydrolase family protein [Chthoniobacterales bacterium]|nr:amidohydrolase family protein [Chthoniobacterales bacterium]
MKPRESRAAAVLLFLVAFAGCQSTGLRLTAEQEQIEKELATISPRNDALAKGSPIIDIHTHTFNARYLPLRNILLGKRDAFPPLTWLISDSCADTLAHALIERTELAPAPGGDGVPRMESASQAQQHRDKGWICGIFLGLLDKAAASGAWRKGMSPKDQLAALDRVADQMNFQEKTAVMMATRMMGMEKEADMSPNGLRGAVRFLWFLTQNDADQTRLFALQYEGAPMRGTPLMVSHMMDLAPVYDQAPSGNELLDFAREQVRRVESFQTRPNSNMIYFVAYAPYRDYWRGGHSGDAEELVRSAIENHGAWGVKVYPPSGYRPAGNSIQPRPTGIRSRAAAEQWDARYGPLPGDKNRALDEKIEKLLLWCIEKDVPVFVHSGTGEFEARKGYGLYHSNPSFWRQFLDSHPAPDGSPCRLRLCLGHAGGGDYWFGGKNAVSWGSDTYEMCRRFPNVYCEITTHAELVAPRTQAFFVDRLAKSFDDSHLDADGKPYPFSFAKKLIYGTDWYLPDASERETVLVATEQAFLHKKLRRHYKDYFFGNALRYLNAGTRLNRGDDSASAVEKRLQDALALAAD